MKDKRNPSKRLLPRNRLTSIILLKLPFTVDITWSFPRFQKCNFLWFLLTLFSSHASCLFTSTMDILPKHMVIFSLPLSPSLFALLSIFSHYFIYLSSSQMPHLLVISLRCPLFTWKPTPSICETLRSHSDATFLESFRWDFDTLLINFSPSFSTASHLSDLSIYHGSIIWFQLGLIPQKYLKWHIEST